MKKFEESRGFIPKHWTDDYLVFAAPKDRQSLAIMRNQRNGGAAIAHYNKRKSKPTRATHAVRITTYAGTIAQLKSAGWNPPKPKKKAVKAGRSGE